MSAIRAGHPQRASSKARYPAGLEDKESFLASVSYALQRGMQVLFQIEEQEIAVERIGEEDERRTFVLGGGRRRQRNLDTAYGRTDSFQEGSRRSPQNLSL